MSQLAQVRDRYASTPRRFDDELRRRARGDRSCLADLVAGMGALSALLGALGAAAGWVPVGVIFVGVALLVVGFSVGMVSQLRSGKTRRQALESGPLVAGCVVTCDPELFERQPRVRWARVVLSVVPDHGWDAGYLRGVAARVRKRVGVSRDGEPSAAERHTVADVHATDDDRLASRNKDGTWAGVCGLPNHHTQTKLRLPADATIDAGTWLVDVMIYPDRLPAGHVSEADRLVALIADVERGLVEHI